MNTKKLVLRLSLFSIFTIIGWFILTFIIMPVFGVLNEIFFSNGDFSFAVIKKLTDSSRVMKSLGNTYVMTFWTVITVNIVGIFQIMVTEYFDIKGSRLLNLAFITPLIYGGISLVSGYKFVYDSGGILTKGLYALLPFINRDWFTGFTGVLFVHTFSLTSSHLLFVKTAFKKIDYSTIEAAKSMGASDFQAFFKVAMPIVKPALFTTTILVALSSMNSFAAPSMLGGRDFYMINSMIQNLNSINRRDLAALLSFILAITCIILLSVFKYIESKGTYISVSKVSTKLKKIKIKNPVLNVFMHAVSYLMFLIYSLPILAIVLFSLSDYATIISRKLPTHLTLENYIRVFSSNVAIRPFINSITLSAIAVAIVLVLCVISSLAIHKFKNKATLILEYTLLIPWIIPGILLVVGQIAIFSTPNPLVFGQILLGGFMLLPIAYAVAKIPSAMRLARASLYMINGSHEEAAKSLGAGPVRIFFKIILPVIMPTIAAIGAISFNSLLSEYTITALLYSVNNVPLGIALRSPEALPDPYSEASQLVYIVVLMIISSITLFLTRKSRNRM